MSASLFSFLGGVTSGFNARKAAEATIAAKKELSADEIQQRIKLSAYTLQLKEQFKAFEYRLGLLTAESKLPGLELGRRKEILDEQRAIVEEQRQLRESLNSDVTGGSEVDDDSFSDAGGVAPKAATVEPLPELDPDGLYRTDSSGNKVPPPRGVATAINLDGTTQ